MPIEGEQVLLVMICQSPVTNQQEIRFFIEELTAQLEGLHIDEYNAIVLEDFNLDQMRDPYIDWLNDVQCFYPVFKLFHTKLWMNIRSCLKQ